jgi:hypothetical protein
MQNRRYLYIVFTHETAIYSLSNSNSDEISVLWTNNLIFRRLFMVLWCLTPLSTIIQLYRGVFTFTPTCRANSFNVL